jgi:gamma-glutamyltranspeptidase/glutathione hydrolase
MSQFSPKFAVAAGDPLTANAAAEVLRAGGSAVDAVIAGALVACVAEPVLAGLLGGGFLMVREADGRAKLLDFFVHTPRRKLPLGEIDFRAVDADFGEATQTFHIGAGSIAVPGLAAGLAEAHERAGRMPFAELAATAIGHAGAGVALTPFQASVLEIVDPIYRATPEALTVFGDGEAPLKAGATYRNEALADVLETYAREGARFVQEGEVAQALLRLDGTHLTALDMKRYQPRWRTPLVAERGDARLILNPPPALGGTLIAFALEMTEHGAGPLDVALALAATSRARLESGLNADPAEGAVKLADADMIARYRHSVAGRKAAVRGTTHISVIDQRGMGAALTITNGEGCGLIAPGTGIMPNNMLGEEDLMPGDMHDWTPDMRLASMMAPMAVEWRRGPQRGAAMMLGTGGANRIRSALPQVAAHIIDGGMRLEDAIVAPRIHVEGVENPKVDFEDRFRGDHRKTLLSAFPEATPWQAESMFFGGVHAVRRDARGSVEAAGDPRRAGVALTS